MCKVSGVIIQIWHPEIDHMTTSLIFRPQPFVLPISIHLNQPYLLIMLSGSICPSASSSVFLPYGDTRLTLLVFRFQIDFSVVIWNLSITSSSCASSVMSYFCVLPAPVLSSPSFSFLLLLSWLCLAAPALLTPISLIDELITGEEKVQTGLTLSSSYLYAYFGIVFFCSHLVTLFMLFILYLHYCRESLHHWSHVRLALTKVQQKLWDI